MDLIDVIYDHRPFEDLHHLTSLYQTFQENDSSLPDNFLGQDQLTRIQHIKQSFRWIPVPTEYHQRFQKSPTISTLLRERANKFPSDQKTSLRGYNLSIAFAPTNSTELALAYEKRADLLLRLGEPQLAQLDIHSVAGNTAYPLKSSKKLIDLQNRCTQLIQSNSIGVKDSGRYSETLYKLKTKNPQIDNVSDFCTIDYQKLCGRRVVVTRAVSPGEVIMVDSPYSIVLEQMLNWDVEHCTNCSKPVVAGVPCDCCSFAWFCCTACKLEATRGIHKYEKYLSYLKSSRIMSVKGLLAARLLFKEGSQELYRIFVTKDPLYFEDSDCVKGFNSQGIYSSNSYLPIYHLISHPDANPMKSKANAFKSMIMVNLIDDTSDFFFRFRYNDDFDQFKDFVASLILRHIEAIEFNAITLSQLTDTKTTLRYGGAVYPVLCLVNHSCDPNCVPVRSLKFLKTSVIAMKPLSPGEEITFSYAPHFVSMEPDLRRKFLFDKYNFRCICEACLSGWGPESKSYAITESQCNTCGRYLLSGKCPKCVVKDLEIKEKLPVVLQQVEVVKELLDKREYVKAVGVSVDCLRFCYGSFGGDFYLCLECQQLFKEAVVGVVSS